MKRCITLFILLLLAFQNSGNIWIIGDFYINQDYIAKNVCINRFDAVPICNGKCYLDNKLKASEKEAQKFPIIIYKEVQLFLQDSIQFSFIVIRLLFKKKFPELYVGSQNSEFIFSIYHPPKCG